jgi:hypothetical protein
MILLVGCASSSKSFYKKKHPTETSRSYSEKRGLMLLESTQLGRNKALYSKHNVKTLKKARKKYKK